mgnify:FL=1
MNVKLDFVLREIAGETLLVPAGKTALDLNGMLTLNETGAALWRMLPEAADAEALTQGLLQEFEGDTGKLWQSNIFGRSFHEIVNEDLQAKLKHMPDDARLKLRQTLERIINEGTGGLICIIL